MSKHSLLTGNNLHISKVSTGNASPVGVQTPTVIGELFADITNDMLWVSIGLTNTDWSAISGSGGPGVTGNLTTSTGLLVTGGTSAVYGTGASITTDPSGIASFGGFQLNTSLANPAWAEGRVFYDYTKHCLSYYNEQHDVTVNLGQEMLVRAMNNTGVLIPNGSVVYPSGTDVATGEATMALANCHETDKCRFVGVATHDIPDGEVGYVTRIGEVGGINTFAISSTGGLVYLDHVDGQMTVTPPNDGAYITKIGAIKKVDPTDGVIVVDIYTSEQTVEQVREVGFSIYETATLTWTNTGPDRTLTLNATSDHYGFYQEGQKYEKVSDSIQIPDEEGLFLIYYNNGTLTYIKNPTPSQIDYGMKNYPLVAYVYWDSFDYIAQYVGNELHTIAMPAEVHAYLHWTQLCKYLSGLSLTNVIDTGDGSSDTHAQFGVASGVIADEDLDWPTPTISNTAGLEIYYLEGTTTTPTLRHVTNTGFSVYNTGTGRLGYNTLSGVDYIVSEVPNGYFVCCHVIAVNENDLNKRVFALMGQTCYATATLARAGAKTELANSRLIGVTPQELKAIATVIFQTDNGFTNSVRARVVSADTVGTDYIDWRNKKITDLIGNVDNTVPVFSDTTFQIYDDLNPTKIAMFQASGITASTTRTFTFPNESGTLLTDSFKTGTGVLVYNNSPTLITPTSDYLTLTQTPFADTDAATKKYVDDYFPIVESDLVLSDVTTWNVTSTGHGFVPRLTGNSAQFLDGGGNWSLPPSGGTVNSYSLTTFYNQTSVNVTHNFGTYPAVQVLTSSGLICTSAGLTIVHNSADDFTVHFAAPSNGSAVATIGSPPMQSVRNIADNYAVLTTDKILTVSAAGKTITLYTAIGNTGKEVVVDNDSTGDIYVTGSQTIQNETIQTIPSDSAIRMYSTGSVWRIY